MKKLILTSILAIAMLLGVAGCSTDTSELQDKLDDLQSQIEQINDRMTDMEEQLDLLEKGNGEKRPVITYCEVVVETTLYDTVDSGTDFIALCNSLDEFKQECLSHGYNFFDSANLGSKPLNSATIAVINKINEYTDEYFEENAFIVCSIFKGSFSGQYYIKDIEVSSGKLTLNITYPRSDIAMDVENNVFLVAGVDKSLVSDVTALEYVLC